MGMNEAERSDMSEYEENAITRQADELEGAGRRALAWISGYLRDPEPYPVWRR